MNKVLITLLTKSGCELCDRSLFILKKVKRKYNVNVEICDISIKPEFLKYKNEIPVILINNEYLSSLKISEPLIRKTLEKMKIKE